MKYSNRLIAEVKEASDIVEIASQYTELKRSGKSYLGLCPFHKDKMPSFSVSSSEQFFYCFGCHEKGDVITFVSKIKHFTINESIEFLAERVGIEISKNDETKNSLEDKMYDIFKDSMIFYHDRFYKSIGKIARDYVEIRKINSVAIEKFQIGYAGEKDELYKFLHNKGYSDKDIENTGLCIKGEDCKYYDYFRKRLIFPVLDVLENVIAFSSRKIEEDGKPKYLNSKDSLIFEKQKNLFALSLARKEDSNFIILVEGIIDAISLYSRGIKNVVALLGTALSIEQAKLIRRYTDKVVISFDSDKAGQIAILPVSEMLETVGIEVRVLQFDDLDVKDPDEYIIKYGADKFKLLIENAISIVEYKVEILENEYNLESSLDKIDFIKEVSKIISELESDIEREIYIDKFVSKYDISKETILTGVNKMISDK